MSIITILLIVIVALLAGMEGVLDEFQFHQPIVACTLIGLVSGHLTEGVMLGGSLQMMALGWANVGAAIAPDAALASVASAIIMVLGLGGNTDTQTVGNSVTYHGISGPIGIAQVIRSCCFERIQQHERITLLHQIDPRILLLE